MSSNNGSSNTNKKKKKVKIYTAGKRKGIPETELIEKLKSQYDQIDVCKIEKFKDFPLSRKTLRGLNDSSYTVPTDIQREAIGLALQGKDILGAAQTGSGKTLAFLVPILEALYCLQWTRLDGVGALVITPTRELAYQIFETFRKVGRYHEFSVGLIIGGKDLKFERKRMDQCNIIICTPGRLLQHMDENPLFDCVNMKILVLDEADRCLDMGFEETMNAIIANLPPKRQTLLFSATQTKSIRDLARLSLKDPSYVSVHENHKYATPEGLQQSYVICELENKLAIIWSFIKNHLKQKCIIFFASCKQVKYMNEIFCKLRPGTSILALYGTLHQMRRMNIYETFCRKQSAILFATDLAARGLDFPEVHWVVQADCPEDCATYIHRVGRTARYFKGGESLLLLLPSEKAMVEDLSQCKVPVNEIEINPNKIMNPVRKIEAFLAKDPSLKESAQRAFVSYVKNIFLMKNKKVFNVQALNTEAYSKSLGLAIAPRIRFLQRHNARIAKQNQLQSSQATTQNLTKDDDKQESNDSGLSDEDYGNTESKSFQISDSDSDDDILKVKRTDHDIDLPSEPEIEINTNSKKKNKAISKVAVAKKLLRKKIMPNKKIIFDDEGEIIASSMKEKRSELAQQYENEDKAGIDIEQARIVLKEEDKFDKQLFKEKVKAKHKEKKKKLKQMKRQQKDEDDDFGTESEDEGPDLSWLPDPDKIYSKNGSNDDESEKSDVEKGRDILNEDTDEKEESNHDSEEQALQNTEKISKTKKRKLVKRKKVKDGGDPPTKKKKKLDVGELSSALSVNEAEELALMLLSNKK